MKFRLAAVIAMAAGCIAFAGEPIPTVKIGDTVYTDVTNVLIDTDGRVIIFLENGGTSTTVDKVPAGFLESWGISKDSQTAAKTALEKITVGRMETAVRSGVFREVDGIVYDVRRPESGWINFSNVKVIQILDDGALIQLSPEDYSTTAIHVRHLPRLTSDTDYLSFTAKLRGTYSYVNKLEDERTIRDYDVGRPCSRDEIPASVLAGTRAFDKMNPDGAPNIDVLATLPNSGELQASGSGFFITEDGFLITNFHVVRDAKKVIVKNSAGVFPATVVQTDKEHDLALLKVSGNFKPLPISSATAHLGERVFTIGFPNIDIQGTEPKYTDGNISSLTGLKDDPNQYQISVPVQPGNSGGPLVNKDGNVVGVVVARLNDLATLVSSGGLPQNVNYAIKAKYVSDLIANLPQVKTIPPQTEAGADGIIPSAQQSVSIVLVY